MGQLINANALHIPLANETVQCVVTSPPYWGLRDYGTDDQIGLEATPEAYVENMVQVFREVWRVLRKDGTVWLNLGDSYIGNMSRGSQGGRAGFGTPREGVFERRGEGLKNKDLAGIPWRVALALQADGWWLRQDIIWAKTNPMPESVKDRCTKSHEYIFLLTKSAKYFYDHDAIKEPLADETFARALRGVSEENKWNKGAPGSTAHTMSKPRKNIRKEFEKKHGGGGSGFDGHSGYFGPDGKLLVDPNGRNKRSVWEMSTRPYPGAHYAVFPPEIPRECIKAGTSEVGKCPECGTPWKRIVNRETIYRDRPNDHVKYQGKTAQPDQTRAGVSTETLGWGPLCACGHDPVPCIVLDPFVGSGTTCLVARELGRFGIGLDLSREYLLNNARTRLGLDKLDAWANGKGKDGESEIEDLPMFGGDGNVKKDHKNMHRDDPHSFHKARLKDD